MFAVSKNRVGELAETVASVEFMNVHELGSDKIRRPEEVADHANFLAADMLVAVSAHVRRCCQKGRSEHLAQCEKDPAVAAWLKHQLENGRTL